MHYMCAFFGVPLQNKGIKNKGMAVARAEYAGTEGYKGLKSKGVP
jgi:hypothetical protein